MKTIILTTVIILSLLSYNCYSQTRIPLPFSKEERFNQHKLYYKDWVGHLKSFDTIINNSENFKHEVIALNHWNRFNVYYKMIPDNRSDIIQIFFDGFNFDRDLFCREYLEVIASGDFHKWMGDIYGYNEKQMTQVCNCVIGGYNKKIINELKQVKERDQKYRGQENIKNEIEQNKLDSINLSVVVNIIEQYGYPNRNLVGINYEAHAFFVILHSNLKTMEKYLPLIESNTNEGLLSSRHLPYLKDRINLLKDMPQEYGTQSHKDNNGKWTLYKLKYDIEKTNKLREGFGLKLLDSTNK